MKVNRENVAVLGATGVVGQVFLSMLCNHPWFQLEMICGSDSRTGKNYGEEVRWLLPTPMPESLNNLKCDSINISLLKQKNIKIVFSALPADKAQTIEPELRDNGFYVFSNASAMRYDENVPILIPEANPESLKSIEAQGFPSGGFVVTNANCSTTGLATALAPIKPFGIKDVFVSTYQSISGAGYPGLSALDIMGNVVPFISKEEEKMQIELKKILSLDVPVYPFCIRIPVLFGHLETVWLTLDTDVETDRIIGAWEEFGRVLPSGPLPSIPSRPVLYDSADTFPQSKMSFWGTPPGMHVFTGRLKKENGKIGFTLLVNNLVKGAAGGSIANAELFCAQYLDFSLNSISSAKE